MELGLAVGFIIGMLLSFALFRETKPVCPAEVLGYDCKRDKGRECDHRESVVLQAQADMAKWREQSAEEAK